MGKKSHNNRYRIERAKELMELSSVLINYRVCNDTGPILNAASDCRQNKPNGNSTLWGYNITNLIFRNPSTCCFLPIKVNDLTLTLDIGVVGICDENSDIIDPMRGLIIDIRITGKAEDQRNVCCTWHLDRHEGTSSDPPPDEAHPRYHFQYGGRLLKSVNENFNHGDSLLLESPRIAHPPLDGILSVDFIISNFFGSKWKNLRIDGEYTALIKSAQKRFWKPYIIAASQPWVVSQVQGKTKWPANDIWPQLA